MKHLMGDPHKHYRDTQIHESIQLDEIRDLMYKWQVQQIESYRNLRDEDLNIPNKKMKQKMSEAELAKQKKYLNLKTSFFKYIH